MQESGSIMKDDNNFEEESGIKPPKESAREGFQGSAAHETPQQAETAAPQESDQPSPNYRDTHKLIVEEYDDGHTIHKREVYIPKSQM